jgi:hypothetical protein
MGNTVSSSSFEIGASSEGVGPQRRVIVAASGTGGHLIPAMHIVTALKKLDPGCVVEFIGAGRPLEEKLIVEKGYTRHTIASAGVKRRKVFGAFQFLARLPRGFSQISFVSSRRRCWGWRVRVCASRCRGSLEGDPHLDSRSGASTGAR